MSRFQSYCIRLLKAPQADEAQQLYHEAEQQMKTALNDLDGAIDYIVSAENKHPNRFDICKHPTQGPNLDTGGSNPFGQPNVLSQQQVGQNTSNQFGEASQPAPIPAFGAPSAPITSGAFGQPSELGQRPTQFGAPSGPAAGAFRQPSALGQKSNPFGPSAASSTTGAFGQPSALGQKPHPFGAPSGPPAAGAFGQSSALGQQQSAFGAHSQLGSNGAFGRPSVLGDKHTPFGNPIAGSAFGGSTEATALFSSFANTNPQAGQQHQKPSPFGTLPGAQPTQFGPAPSQSSNSFGQPSGQTNKFGAVNTSAPANPFGTVTSNATPATAFGVPSPIRENPVVGAVSNIAPVVAPNPFASAQAPAAPASPASTNPNPLAVQAPRPNPFGAPPITANPIGTSSQNPLRAATTNGFPNQEINGHAAGGNPLNVSTYSTKGPDGKLSMFKGKRVLYKEDVPGVQSRDGRWEKIWFPDGAPKHDPNTELDERLYDDATKSVYMNLQQTHGFANGLMPLLPPKREWCSFDF